MAPHLSILFVFLHFSLSVFSQEPISVRLTLQDNLARGQSLGNISSLDTAIPRPPAGASGYFRVIMEPNLFASRRFAIDPRTGEISTLVALDRDELCAQLACCANLECESNLTVFIQPTSQLKYRVVLTLVFVDANDNTPKIPGENITIPESATIGSTRPLLTATDGDSKTNGVVQYAIVDPTGTFGLYMASPTRPMLQVLKQLDADDPARRNFLITYSAKDGGKPPRTGTSRLNVTILDENDNPPIFTQYSRIIFISENETVGSEVYRFNASDADTGAENKRVTFRLDDANSRPEGVAGRKFQVVAETGAVLVRSKLDYDVTTERVFTLVVEATDHGSPQRSSTATLSINLKNVNDNPPSISVTNSEPLEEGKSSEQRVRTISVSDADQGNSIRVSCALRDSPGFKIKTITAPHYFDIVTERAFDFETTPSVNVTIVCSDQQPPYRTAVKTVNVPVVDVNDHRPVFSPDTYSKVVSENTPVSSEVVTVRATDSDSGRLGTIRYSLDAPGRRWFSIDAVNGIIFVNKTLDRETVAVIDFHVTAVDMGLPPKSATAAVKITLTDVNDNPPYLMDPKAVDVVENARPGTVVTQVQFRDGDEGKNGQVDFKLLRDQNHNLEFLNMTEDGKVVVIKPIDREKTSEIFLDIQARDRGTPVMESTHSLIVRVLDLNDNAPRLLSPLNYTTFGRTVFSNSPYNTTVGQLKGDDPDLRENGTVVYDIIDTNGTGMFRIESDTGRIYSAWKYPSQPGHGLYSLLVRLSDKGRPPLSSHFTVFAMVGPPTTTKAAGISNIIILVLILIASVAIAVALVMAILWARSRNKRNPAAAGSPDYAEYDPAVKKARSMAGSDVVSNMDMVSGLGVDPLGDSASTIVRSKTPSRLSQYADYVVPYPMPTTASKRDSRSPHSFEASYPSQIRTFGHQSPTVQNYPMENFATVGRAGATSPASSYHQQRPGAFGNAHLLPEMFEDDPRQSELSYDDSGKGGSVDDVGRFVLAQHGSTHVASSNVYPFQHHHPHRVSLRGHPGGPGPLAGAEATLC